VTGDITVATKDDHTDDRSAFVGMGAVFSLIGALVRRPRFRDPARRLDAATRRWRNALNRRDRSDRKGLPMVCLVRPYGPDNLLNEIRELLKQAKPDSVRHTYVSLGQGNSADEPVTEPKRWTTDDVSAVRRILRAARNGLVIGHLFRDRRLHFPLFSLVDWLMDQERDADDQDPDGTLRRNLKRHGLIQRINSVSRSIQDELPEGIRWKIPLWTLRVLALITFRIAVTGRVRALSGRYWWFMHQPHLAPEMTNTFARFAGRLIDGEWQKEAPEQVARLLVNAFLEDLRREHRLRPWHLFRRRRMTYPVLLLDNITVRNGGYDLLILINRVRNQVGVFDPLLVVSASRTVPPDAGAIPDRPHYDAKDAFLAFNAWQNQLLDDRRARRDTAWYLPLRIPGTPTPEQRADAEREWPPHSGYESSSRESRPPFFTSRWFRIAVAAAVVAGAGVIAGTTYQARCNTWDANLSWTGSECIGVSDGSTDLFQPSNETIRQVEQTVLAQNERAAAMHASAPQRPYITIVDLQAITSSNNTADGLTAERESLEGVAVAQQRQLDKSGSSDPIVRVLIANAGKNMLQGATVAQQLVALARRDSSLVGVVALDISSRPTHATITALANAGLPMVAAALSQDSLADNNPLYFQVDPQDRREAAMVAAFALQHLAQDPTLTKSVRVYYSDDVADTYSANLRQDVVHAFASQGFPTSAIAFTPSAALGPTSHQRTGEAPIGNAVAAGRDTCGYHGFVFFAGRGVPDYGDFLSGAEQCTNTAVFIGDDDVSRYVANSALRGQYSVPYYYVSFAPKPMASPPGAAHDFYTELQSLFRFEQQPSQDRSLDGHAALSYDAALVVITATEYLREGTTVLPVTPGNVWREITDIHSAQTSQPGADKAIDGATGTIDNNGDITRHVPLNKQIAILQVRNGKVDPNVQGLCGTVAGRVPSTWCPPGS
jgi:ABC-type branched-subunit amino acid transport system substrate-binding protein